MGWNLRRTLNLGGGFRVNLSKRGIGVSGGLEGFRVGLGPRGKRLQISIPGTGVLALGKTRGGELPSTRPPVSFSRSGVSFNLRSLASLWLD